MTADTALLTIVNLIVVLWVGLSVQVKRWHDRDKSGWWALINLIPVIGQIWVFIECGILRGSSGDNRFGHDSISEK